MLLLCSLSRSWCCGAGLLCSCKAAQKKERAFFFLNALKLLITYGLWLRLMAKPYRAGSDVRLIQHYAQCACRCSRHGSFTPCIDANFRCLLRANTHSNFSEMKRWERQWWAACVPIFLHFSHHLRGNQCGMVSAHETRPSFECWRHTQLFSAHWV